MKEERCVDCISNSAVSHDNHQRNPAKTPQMTKQWIFQTVKEN